LAGGGLWAALPRVPSWIWGAEEIREDGKETGEEGRGWKGGEARMIAGRWGARHP